MNVMYVIGGLTVAVVVVVIAVIGLSAIRGFIEVD